MPSERPVEGGNELGRFLRARREGTLPETVGLPGAGLRRDELATLSGISTD